MEKEEKKPVESDADKIARIEQALVDKDTEIEQLRNEKTALEKRINSLKIDGLVKQVEPKVKVEPEEIEFDFDL